MVSLFNNETSNELGEAVGNIAKNTKALLQIGASVWWTIYALFIVVVAIIIIFYAIKYKINSKREDSEQEKVKSTKRALLWFMFLIMWFFISIIWVYV
ncbi:hypothetical protein [Mesomycoplasma lagogenitalium]|uniref:Uncharacterized protein n=1 Tax=Mesomycoplasma lagogenitalium TaxID=171286 RepID=A0ABY8LVH2_9BACT|nr:hypothetical protein [Mesomycoplasma lagogenitalium]WGI36266.1 hypothetical protein QEG99_02185 [Mesomycoplasma lagogenitalium]